MTMTAHELANRLTALTRDLLLIRSTEQHPGERRRCLEFIGNHLVTLENVRVRTYESGGYTSLVALPEGVERPVVLLNGHIDVIEHPGLESYRGVVRDGRIWGPGSGDMKGAVAIMLELFRDLQRTHPGASVGLALTSDEERGGENGLRYLFEDAGLRCQAAIIPDGGSLNRVTVQEKGILHLRIRRTGQPGHAARPWLGNNALESLLAALTRLRHRFDQWSQDGETDEDHWFPTAAITLLSVGNRTINRIPGSAEALVDIRFPPPHSVASMLELAARELGDGVQLEPVVTAEPAHLLPDPLFCAVTREITGAPARLARVSGGSDARFIARHGIPVMLSRPEVGNLHAEDEWIDIASMVTYSRICATYIRRRLELG